jgi:endonuclease/exonuclease/phosphatase family metal-dependent hydrolase
MNKLLLFCYSVALSMLFSSLSLHAQETEMTIATYNIRYDNPQDAPDTWDKRFPVITKMVKFHEMDIFGIQEALHHQVINLAEGLPNYSYVGVGRDDGAQKGEYSAIFYDKDQYKVLEDDTFWLSEDTTKPNKGWDASLPRVCTWAKFEEMETGKQFYVFNTHFDHIGVQARINSATLIMEKAKEIAGDETVILTGDFNIDQNNEAYKSLRDSEMFNDSYEVADLVYENNGTFNSFDNTKSTDRRIDHIFVTDDIKVRKYGILTDTYHNRYPSDHFPVLVEVAF